MTNLDIGVKDAGAKRRELCKKYPRNESLIDFLCNVKRDGTVWNNGNMSIDGQKYLREYMTEKPPDFKISARCCDVCKKRVAHDAQKDFELVITGERFFEGGQEQSIKICMGVLER